MCVSVTGYHYTKNNVLTCILMGLTFPWGFSWGNCHGFPMEKTTAQVFGVKIFFSETGYESGSHVQLRVPSIPFYPIVFPVDSRKYPSISQNFPKKHPHNPIIVLWNTHHSLPMTSALSSIQQYSLKKISSWHPPWLMISPFTLYSLPSGKRLHSELENHHV